MLKMFTIGQNARVDSFA